MWWAFLWACTSEPADTDVVLDPTFTNVHEEILQPSCSFSACHGSGAGYLELVGDASTNHAVLVGIVSFGSPEETLVIPGDPDGSYLVKKIDGAEGIEGDPMPPPGGGLSEEQIALVRAWIEAGAPND